VLGAKSWEEYQIGLRDQDGKCLFVYTVLSTVYDVCAVVSHRWLI
jgi:hypothetical protein